MIKKSNLLYLIIFFLILSLALFFLFIDRIKYGLKEISRQILIDEFSHKNIILKDVSQHFGNFIINSQNKYKDKDSLNLLSKETFESNSYLVNLNKYSYPFFSYYELGEKPVAYLEEINDKILIASGMGYFSYFNPSINNNNGFEFINIKSNFSDFIDDPFFRISSKSSIKDIFIDEDYLYVSFTNLKLNKCYNISILRSKINLKELNFEKFFDINECVKNDTYLNGHSTGGRIINYKDKLLVSIGEFQHRNLAQDLNNNFGKIISIDKLTKETSVISFGHRNVQGLKYIVEKDIIISTEHGPMGGDEININNLKNRKIKNFGWPQSSYGEHYSEFITCESRKFEKYNLAIYQIVSLAYTDKCKFSPLYKSHKKYGFEEPLKFYVPSIGISEIIRYENLNKNIFIATSLRANSLFILEFNNDYTQVINEEKIMINERIRDIIYSSNEKKYFILLEDSPAIGFIDITTQ